MDELVKQLREFASLPEHCKNVADCDKCTKEEICLSFTNKQIFEIATQAADAIEELSKRVDESIPKGDVEIIIEELSKPKWISVTERLPEAHEDVLLLFPNNQAAGFRDRDCCWKVYSGNGFYTEVAEYEIKPTHWAKKLPEPPKEES